jgi:hypothetical protein
VFNIWNPPYSSLIVNCNNKREGSKNPTTRCAIPLGPWYSHFDNLIHIHIHLSSPTANCLPAWSPIRLDPSFDRLSNTRLDTTHSPDHALHTNASEKMLRFSLSDYVHSPRAQALPSNPFSYKHRVWSFL